MIPESYWIGQHGNSAQDQFLAHSMIKMEMDTTNLYRVIIQIIILQETMMKLELYGDQTLWWIFNDKGNIHTETETILLV